MYRWYILPPDSTFSHTLHRPLLVTGLPRSGTSWIGQLLSGAPKVRYRYESFNPDWVPRLKGEIAQFRYLNPQRPGPAPLVRAVDQALEGKQSLKQRARAVFRGYGRSNLRNEGRLIIKDPTACLLAGWLARRCEMDVLLLIRHPCGFASSIQSLNWPLRLRRLLNQERLMEDHLANWEADLRRAQSNPWASLAAFWCAVHRVLLNQSEGQKNWHRLHYETLCLDPLRTLHDLARELSLDLVPIQPQRSGHRSDPGSTRKDSERMAGVWRERMSKEAIATVMGTVNELGMNWLVEENNPSQSA